MKGLVHGRVPSVSPTWSRHVALRAGIAAGVGVGSVLFPFPAIVFGVGVLVIPVLYFWAPPLQPYVEELLRAPIEAPAKRRARLALVGMAGVFVITAGSFGATMRARRMTETEQIASLRSDAEENLTEILQRAEAHLEKGHIDAAALVLMNREAIPYVETELRLEVDDLAGRVHRCNDPDFVLGVLRSLSREQLIAFESGTEVPERLRFGHPELDRRAIELARALMDQVGELPVPVTS